MEARLEKAKAFGGPPIEPVRAHPSRRKNFIHKKRLPQRR